MSFEKIERLLKYADQEVLVPDALLFRELSKIVSQDSLIRKPDVLSACTKIFTSLSEQDGAIDALLSYKEQHILKSVLRNFYHFQTTKNISALEDVLDILHAVVDCSDEGATTCMAIAKTLTSFITQQDVWSFSVQLEASKLLNLLLENATEIPSALRESKELKTFLECFGGFVANAGDYELQATVMEALFRLVSPAEKSSLLSSWFPTKQLQNSFLSIRNEEFETDCRKFLNSLNSHDPVKQRVFSFPVICVTLGRYQLKRPSDSRITEFWLDFNLHSKSISTFVNDDSADKDNSEWEMVCIKADTVKDFRVNVTEDKTILILKLFEPAYSLAPFCPEAPEHYVKINFERSSDISSAVRNLFGQIKYVELPISSPSISSTPARGSCRASLAIFPLAVHSSTPPEERIGKEQAISDQTVSSSVCPKKEEKAEPKNEAAPVQISVSEHHSNNVNSNKVTETTLVPETQDLEAVEVEAADTNRPEKTEEKENKELEADSPEATPPADDDKVAKEVGQEPVDFIIDSRQAAVSRSKKTNKKGKKLLSSHQLVFQDSPDENYDPAPVRPPSKQQQRKARKAAKKSKVMSKEKMTSEAASTFDFEDENVRAVNVKEKIEEMMPEDNPIQKTSKKKGKVLKENKKSKENINLEKSSDGANGGKAMGRSTRSRKKEITYKELSDDSDFEDLERSDAAANTSSTFSTKTSSLKKDWSKKHDKSVSFISPVGEVSYYEVDHEKNEVRHFEMDNYEEENIKNSEDASESDLKPLCKDINTQDDAPKNKRGRKRRKDNTDELDVPSKKSKTSPAQKKQQKVPMPKPFERNIHLGWGNKPKSAADFTVYDFSDDHEEPASSQDSKNQETSYPDTPWTVQKAKKDRIKKSYKLKSKLVKEKIKNESCGESGRDVQMKKSNSPPVGDSSVQKFYGKIKMQNSSQSSESDESTDQNHVVVSQAKLINMIEVNGYDSYCSSQDSYEQGIEQNKKLITKKDFDGSIDVKTKEKSKMKKTKKTKDGYSKRKSMRGSKQIEQSSSADDEESGSQSSFNKKELGDELQTKTKKKGKAKKHVTSEAKKKKTRSDNRVKETNDEELATERNDLEVLPKKTGRQAKNKITKKESEKEKKDDSSADSEEDEPKSNEKLLHKDKCTIKKAKEMLDEHLESYIVVPIADDDNKSPLSSVEPSQEFFNETPMGLTKNTRKEWLYNLNQVFENIEANASKRQPKKKLWKSPVIIMKEDMIECKQVTVTPKPFKKQTQRQKNSEPGISPFQSKNIESTCITPIIPEDNGAAQKFAQFCQNILNQSNKSGGLVKAHEYVKKTVDVSMEDEEEEEEIQALSPTASPPMKKKKTRSSDEHVVPGNLTRSTNGMENTFPDLGEQLEEKLKLLVANPTTPDVSYVEEKEFNEVTSDKLKDLASPNCHYPGLDSHEIMKKYMALAEQERGYDSDNEESGDLTPEMELTVDTFKAKSFNLNDTVGEEIQTVLQSFGSNINKTLNMKKQSIEKFMSKVTKMTGRRLQSVWKDQQQLRKGVDSVFQESCSKELDGWSSVNLQKHNKMQNILSQLQDAMKDQFDGERKRVQRLKILHQKYSEEKNKMAVQEENLQSAMQSQLRYDIKKLRNQMLNHTKSMEICNIRRSLQTILNGV